MGTDSVGRVVASAGTPGAATEEAGVANTTSAISKQPPMGAPMEAESSSVVGWYTERGSSSSWKTKKKRI